MPILLCLLLATLGGVPSVALSAPAADEQRAKLEAVRSRISGLRERKVL